MSVGAVVAAVFGAIALVVCALGVWAIWALELGALDNDVDDEDGLR